MQKVLQNKVHVDQFEFFEQTRTLFFFVSFPLNWKVIEVLCSVVLNNFLGHNVRTEHNKF